MKYDADARFDDEYRRLPRAHKAMFRLAVRMINGAYARRSGWPVAWPANLRMHPMKAHRGVWEMTWSFAGPDGRATFEFVDLGEGEFAIRWRRIGTHAIFGEP